MYNLSWKNMPDPILIICNPLANQGGARKAAAALQSASANLPVLTWVETCYHRHAAELARQSAAQGYRRVIAFGGDGTVHEVINGLLQIPAGQRPELGIVPAGYGNDFASSLAIPRDPQTALQTALTGERRWIDAAQMTDDAGRREYFINTLGIGFDAQTNLLAHRAQPMPGFNTYLAAALRTFFYETNPIRIRAVTDNHSWEDEVLVFIACNGRREGKLFKVAPNAREDDGRLDFIAVRTISPAQILATIPYIMRGDQHRLSYCYQGHFTRLELKADTPLVMHADGEVIADLDANVHSVVIETVPGAVCFAGPAITPFSEAGGDA
jgi:YegS/Rv2252/BmrU family lipid kinase